MRITVDIPEPTYRRIETLAAHQGCSIEELILRGVERVLEGPAGPQHKVKLPLVRSKRPGSLDLTNAQIYEISPFP